MKTKYWIGILGAVLAVCLGLSFFLLRPRAAEQYVVIVQDGVVVQRLSLNKDRTLQLTGSNGGTNTVQIQDGKVAVIQASCPDHVCMAMGWRDSGLPIACLPNGLILSFEGDAELDGTAG